MEAAIKKSGLDLMREKFPANQISHLPKGGVLLAFVGHAALTDRLLDCDPSWFWEPLAMNPDGLPVMDSLGGMWIRLTVCGVTRIGYGHAGSKTGGDAIKEVIGDDLLNAAMRFGAALDLWHKGVLHADEPDPEEAKRREEWIAERLSAIATSKTIGELKKIMDAALIAVREKRDQDAEDRLVEASAAKVAKVKPPAKPAITNAPSHDAFKARQLETPGVDDDVPY